MNPHGQASGFILINKYSQKQHSLGFPPRAIRLQQYMQSRSPPPQSIALADGMPAAAGARQHKPPSGLSAFEIVGARLLPIYLPPPARCIIGSIVEPARNNNNYNYLRRIRLDHCNAPNNQRNSWCARGGRKVVRGAVALAADTTRCNWVRCIGSSRLLTSPRLFRRSDRRLRGRGRGYA